MKKPSVPELQTCPDRDLRPGRSPASMPFPRTKTTTAMILCLTLAVAMIFPLSCSRQSPEELFEQALASARDGYWNYARDYARKAVSGDPRHLEAQLLLGISYYYLEQPGRAVNALRQAADWAPDSFTAQYLYGWILCENRDFAAALPPLRRAFEIETSHHGLLTLLARAALEQNLFEGIRYLQLLMAHTEYQDQPEPFNAIAVLWMGEPDYVRANYFFRQALQRDAGNPVILQNLAVLHDVYLHDETQALDYYRRCLAASQSINDHERAENVTNRLRRLARRRSARQ